MGTVTLNTSANEDGLLSSLASRRSTTVNDLVAQHGTRGAVIQALQEELNLQVQEGTVGQDVVDLLLKRKDWSVFWSPVHDAYANGGFIPPSIVDSATARIPATTATSTTSKKA